MMSGLIARIASYPSPQLSSTPGEKPSATTSDIASGRSDHWQIAPAWEPDRLRILVQERCTPPHHPRGAGCQPFARGVAEGAAELRVLDVRAALPREPVRIHRVLVRFAQRCPQHAGLLRFAPRHGLVGERAHEALNGLHGVVALLRTRARAWNEPSARRQGGLLGIETSVHAVLLEQRNELPGLT